MPQTRLERHAGNREILKTSSSPISLEESFTFCDDLIHHFAKSFYFAARFLPLEKRKATYALYGFCRFTDNLVDDLPFSQRDAAKLQLDDWQHRFETGLADGDSNDPILKAFLFTLFKYGIDPKLPLELIEGVRMDLTLNRYSNYDQLRLFCYRVASVVGLMMCEILGYRNGEETLRYAEELGEAMQLTNVLRDIGEDFANDRVYLTVEDMARFNYAEDDLANGVVNGHFIDLMEHYIAKAETLYDSAEAGIQFLDKDGRFAIRSAGMIYRRILQKIRNIHYDVFNQRAFVPTSRKIQIVLSEAIRSKIFRLR